MMKDDPSEVAQLAAQWLRDYRRDNRLSATAAARGLQVSRRTVHDIEQGGVVKLSHIERIAELMGSDVISLIYLYKPRPPHTM